MKEQIENIRKYFANKMLAGDFKVIKFDDKTIRVIIDELYLFTIWKGDENLKTVCKPWDSSYGNFMQIEGIFTDSMAIELFMVIKPLVDNYNATEGRRIKLEQLEQLKKELEVV